LEHIDSTWDNKFFALAKEKSVMENWFGIWLAKARGRRQQPPRRLGEYSV
jgi:hypothetical protein